MITAAKASSIKRKTCSFLGEIPNSTGKSLSFAKCDIGSCYGKNTKLTYSVHLVRLSDTGNSKKNLDQNIPQPYTWKRCLDIFCILLSLPMVLPLMAMIVVWIRLVSRGPALFRQERIGKNGKRFILYKFRSMRMNSGTSRHETHLRYLVKTDSPMTKLDLLCDYRLILGGCLLRAAGLDELPQLLNVIKGQMSLVGPRPCLPQEYIYYSLQQRERFNVLPGLTGSWQVSGKNLCTFSEMNIMDVYYVKNSSLMMDLIIMLKTPSTLANQLLQTAQQKLFVKDIASGSTHDTASKYDTRKVG